VIHVRLFLVASLAALGLVVPGSVGAHGTVPVPLVATVGTQSSPNAYAISLTDASGAKVDHLDPGTYQVTVHDYATLHNFDLTGPGVAQSTDIEGTGDASWTITVTNGTYHYVCDVHPTLMHGSFTAGTVVAPPPPKPIKKLVAQVGPKRSITVKTSSGARVRSTAAGKYRLTVKDLTRTDNFHLTGRGVNKKTGVKSKGTSIWSVTLRAGKVTYRSDTHKTLRGSFSVK
jgi:hypothetical protein